MHSAEQVRQILRALPDGVALRILAKLEAKRTFEAERIAEDVLGDGTGMELIASIVRIRTKEGVL